jgi:hypothetical protein
MSSTEPLRWDRTLKSLQSFGECCNLQKVHLKTGLLSVFHHPSSSVELRSVELRNVELSIELRSPKHRLG